MMRILLLKVLLLPISEAWSKLQYASQGLALKESRNTHEDLISRHTPILRSLSHLASTRVTATDPKFGGLFDGQGKGIKNGGNGVEITEPKPDKADPTCYQGLPDGPKRVCCSPKCWTCGSHSMCNDPKKFFETTGNNISDCCDTVIQASNKKCDKAASPCILSEEFRREFKRQLTLPINDERHAHNKRVIKQRRFRWLLYNEIKIKYDFALDIAKNVESLAGLKVQKSLENVAKFKAKLELARSSPGLLKIGATSNATGPVQESVFVVQVEINEDEARFYKQIKRNAVWVAKNCTEGLNDVDRMKVAVQVDLDKIDDYDSDIKILSTDANETHADAKMLWQQWLNSAKHFDCTPIPVVEHCENKIAVPNTKTRRVPVTCQVGYDSKESKNSLRCLKQGDFSKKLYGQLTGVATCVGRNCGKPPDVKKATTVVQDIIHPNEAAYSCYEGHSMDGRASAAKTFAVKCNKHGKFNFKSFEHKCEPIRCGKALVIANSFPIGGTFVYSQVLDYKCKQGYTIDGAASGIHEFEIICLATGEFSVPQKCRPVQCGPNPTYAHTKLLSKAEDQHYQMESKYSCDSGYSLDQKYGGPTSFTLSCHHDGEFVLKGSESAAIPVCRAVSAGMSPRIRYGNYQSKVMYYPETAVVAAETGYSLVAQAGRGLDFTISVNAKGKYDGVQEFKPVKCGAPPTVAKAKTSFAKDMAVYKDILSYDCTKGYSTDASKLDAKAKFTILCQADGTLSAIPGRGECVNIDDCAEHTCGPFGTCEDKLLNYTCNCNDGYESTWENTTNEFICGNIDDCGPEACGVGECKDGLNDYECICPSGYEVKETGEGDTCGKVTCGTPPRVEFSATKPPQIQSEKLYYKGVAIYECGPGYTLNGKATGENGWTITCGADKSFSTGETCKPVECGNTPTVTNAVSGADSATFNQTVRYECEEGYSIDATPTGDNHFSVTCQATGDYSLPMLCQAILCGEPDQVANAQRPSGKLRYQDTITYTCFEGFTIDGQRDSDSQFEATCLKTGKLTSLETCNPKICGEPPKKINVLHATVPDMGRVHYPTPAEITCRDGYTVGGDPKGMSSFLIKCGADGHFERYDKRECEAVRCGAAPQLPNATMIDITNQLSETLDTKDLAFGLTATYKCATGFSAGGEYDAKDVVKAQCLPSGAFSVPTDDLMCRNIDDCSKHTCGAKGTCIDLIGASPAYTCKCESGYEISELPNGEKFCGNIDDCGKDKCGPGVCQDRVNDFTCICPLGHFLGVPPGGEEKDKTCLPVLCKDKAPGVENAERLDSHEGPIVFPTTLRWACKTGYSTDSSPLDSKSEFQASCKSHGELMGMMRCLPVTCGTPHMFAFTHLEFPRTKTSKVVFGQSAKYKCFEGYSLQGAADGATEFSTECKATGSLGDPEVCEPIKCGRAPRIEKGRASVSGDVVFGQDVQYECDKGHTLSGLVGGTHHFHRKCQKDGTFEEAEGDCKPVSAGKVPTVTHARVFEYDGTIVENGEDLTAVYPHAIEYQCHDGFSLTGGLEGQTKFVTQVNSIGQLVPALPAKCKRIVFTVQGEIKNAQNGAGLVGAKVSVEGRHGEVHSQNGFFNLFNIDAGQVKLKYTKDGFIPAEKTIDISGDISSGGLADIAMSPVMKSSEWRAVVKWSDYPADLDTYAMWGTQTVCWYDTFAQAGYEGKLEVDDTDGHGPETVYLSNVGDCEGGAHACDIKYMINDYDDTGTMFEDSEAQVTLYHGEHQAGSWKISECEGALSEDRYWWHVFTIDGKTNKVKWHCGMGAVMLLQDGSNATISSKPNHPVDFEKYVGPFPGRFMRRSGRAPRGVPHKPSRHLRALK